MTRHDPVGLPVSLGTVEIDDLKARHPLITDIAALCPNRPLAHVGVFVVGHVVMDLICLVDGLIALGADPSSITVVGKPYQYLHRDLVTRTLAQRHGITVLPIDDVEVAIDDHHRRTAAKGQRSVVVDQGGYVLPMLLEHRPDIVDHVLGVVEGTRSGITRLRPYPEVPVPIFNVAESRLKNVFEPPAIAVLASRRLHDLTGSGLRAGDPALVIGFGAVGQCVAQALRAEHLDVAVTDRDLLRLIAAHEHQFRTDIDLAELLADHRPKLIVGATGATSMRREQFAAITRSCYLASVASRNTEFALEELHEMATAATVEPTGTVYSLAGDIDVTCLADGQPVNFFDTDGLPDRHSDLLCAAVLIGAATIATNGLAGNGDPTDTDRALDAAGLPHAFYHLTRHHNRM